MNLNTCGITHLLYDVALSTKCQPSECQHYEGTPSRQSDLKGRHTSARDPQGQCGVLKETSENSDDDQRLVLLSFIMATEEAEV